MGDVIVKMKVKSDVSGGVLLDTYFDSGSPYTFIAEDKAKKLKGVMSLPKARRFSGLGDGRFQSLSVIQLWFNMLGIWCSHIAYIVDRSIIENDIMVGHDFMQNYNVKLDMKKKTIVLNKKSLKLAQKVKRCGPLCRAGGSTTIYPAVNKKGLKFLW